MSRPGWSVITGGQVALAATTAKSVLGVKAHANSGLELYAVDVSFDGIVGGNEAVLIEVCRCTWATNSPGTNSTSVTPAPLYGPRQTAGFTAGKTWTTEPTALTVLEEFRIHPQGSGIIQLPLGQAYDCDLAEGFVLRMTADDAVNARATMKVERI